MPKEILVTGSEGFVGRHLQQELHNQGYETVGTSLSESVGENVYQCDITDPLSLNTLIETLKPQAIFHLAAFVSAARSGTNPVEVFRINVDGTRNLFEAVRRIPNYRPRIILIGSAEEFGVPPAGILATEDTPLNPRNPYAESKVLAWKLAQEYIGKHHLDIVSAIPFNHTGPGQRLGFIAPDIASQIADIEKGIREPVVITGNVSHRRNFTDVRDVVRAYRLLLELGRTGERYIVCNDQSIPLSKIVNTLIGLSTVKIEHQIDPSRGRPADVQDISGSHEKITKETGWQPEIPLEQTLEDLLDWYRGK